MLFGDIFVTFNILEISSRILLKRSSRISSYPNCTSFASGQDDFDARVLLPSFSHISSATQDIKKSPDYVQKSIKDVLSETEEVRKYLAENGMPDEKKIFSEMLADLVREQFGAQLHVYSEDDGAEHDPKGKARHSRPLKPAILLE